MDLTTSGLTVKKDWSLESGRNQKKISSTAFDQYSYPEFERFHSNFQTLKLETEEGEIVIKNYGSTIYLGIFMTDYSPGYDKQLEPLLPKSDISFLL